MGHFSFYSGVVLCWLWKAEHTEKNLGSAEEKKKKKNESFPL
jgi:hypothetical protein